MMADFMEQGVNGMAIYEDDDITFFQFIKLRHTPGSSFYTSTVLSRGYAHPCCGMLSDVKREKYTPDH